MADQDFNIKVVTTADTSGLKATSAEMDAVQRKAASFSAQTQKQVADAEAKWAASPINPKNAAAVGGTAGAGGTAAGGGGLSGTAIGIGTIVTLLTVAINKWKEFDEGLTRAVEKSLEAEEKFRALGESILDMQEKAINARRLATEPLEQSFTRLQQEIVRLNTEMNIAMSFGQLDAWKKLNAELSLTQSQLKGITNELQHQKDAADKLAEANAKAEASFIKGAVATAQPQVQAVLQNEERARQEREKGNERSADLFQKTADNLKKSMTDAQRDEYEGLTRPTRLGPKAGAGESQEAIDEVARNQINFDRQLKGEQPLPVGRPQGNQDIIDAMYQIWGR